MYTIYGKQFSSETVFLSFFFYQQVRILTFFVKYDARRISSKIMKTKLINMLITHFTKEFLSTTTIKDSNVIPNVVTPWHAN